MSTLSIPSTGQVLQDGDLVVLSRFPNMKWFVHNGTYTYNDQQYMGWYFRAVNSQTIIPVTEKDLRLITILSADGIGTCFPTPSDGCHHDGHHHHHHNHDCGCHDDDNDGCNCHPVPPPSIPFEVPFTRELKQQLDAAMITVPTLEDLEALKRRELIDGKIVLVCSVNASGRSALFKWYAAAKEFRAVELAKMEDLNALDLKITDRIDSGNWSQIPK